tara:strand:- start:242 stop:589 length:348 start_codon:yes stop_codon:yes gene_type:complete
MMNIIKVSSNRVDVEFSGKIDRDQMKKVLDNMFAAIMDMEHGLLMYRIGELEMLTIGAIVLELKNLPKIFRLVQKIDRIAVFFSRLDTNGYRDRRQTHSRLGNEIIRFGQRKRSD